MHIDSTGVRHGKKVAFVFIRTETKNLYMIFIADSSMLATVFVCTCTLLKSYSKDNRAIESWHDLTLIESEG